MNADTLVQIEVVLGLLPYGLMFFMGLCLIKLAIDVKGT